MRFSDECLLLFVYHDESMREQPRGESLNQIDERVILIEVEKYGDLRKGIDWDDNSIGRRKRVYNQNRWERIGVGFGSNERIVSQLSLFLF